jgi:hypothetical protein
MKARFVNVTHSQYSIQALDWVFARPIFRGSDFTAEAGIPKATAKRLLAALQQDGILKVLVPGTGRRAAVIALSALLNIAEGRDGG